MLGLPPLASNRDLRPLLKTVKAVLGDDPKRNAALLPMPSLRNIEPALLERLEMLVRGANRLVVTPENLRARISECQALSALVALRAVALMIRAPAALRTDDNIRALILGHGAVDVARRLIEHTDDRELRGYVRRLENTHRVIGALADTFGLLDIGAERQPADRLRALLAAAAAQPDARRPTILYGLTCLVLYEAEYGDARERFDEWIEDFGLSPLLVNKSRQNGKNLEPVVDAFVRAGGDPSVGAILPITGLKLENTPVLDAIGRFAAAADRPLATTDAEIAALARRLADAPEDANGVALAAYLAAYAADLEPGPADAPAAEVRARHARAGARMSENVQSWYARKRQDIIDRMHALIQTHGLGLDVEEDADSEIPAVCKPTQP